jgi:hypothetical protein
MPSPTTAEGGRARKGVSKHQRSVLTRRIVTAAHHVTWFLGTRFPRAIPLVFVVGYPKSGTTWVSQLVADYLQLPFPQFSLLPIGFEAVVHGHEEVRSTYPKCVYNIRDGRDALVSMYFHLARSIPAGDHPRMPRRIRRNFPGLVNKDHVRGNLAGFIERQMRRPQSSRFNWGDHVRTYFDRARSDVPLLRYEDLLASGPSSLAAAMTTLSGAPADEDRARLTIEKFAFEKQAGRSSGAEDRSAFLRKGQAGDWRTHFTRDAAEIFDRFCGDALIAAGYEHDRRWVESVS